MNNITLNKKLSTLPENLKAEVADFVDFLLTKSKHQKKKKTPKFGSARGMFKISDDFDEPLEDFKEYMQSIICSIHTL